MLKIAQIRVGNEGKYSSDIRLYSCEFSNFESNRITGKRSNIRNLEYESIIRPILSVRVWVCCWIGEWGPAWVCRSGDWVGVIWLTFCVLVIARHMFPILDATQYMVSVYNKYSFVFSTWLCVLLTFID